MFPLCPLEAGFLASLGGFGGQSSLEKGSAWGGEEKERWRKEQCVGPLRPWFWLHKDMVSESISSNFLTLIPVVVLREAAFFCFKMLLDGMATVVFHWQCGNDTVPMSEGYLASLRVPEQPWRRQRTRRCGHLSHILFLRESFFVTSYGESPPFWDTFEYPKILVYEQPELGVRWLEWYLIRLFLYMDLRFFLYKIQA